MLHALLCSRELGVCLGTAAWEGARGHGTVLASAPHAHGALRTDVDALHPFWGPAALTPSVPNAWMRSPFREHPPPLGHHVPAVTVPKLSPRLLSPRLWVPDPLALPDKDPSVGDGARQRGAGGAGLGRVPPNTNQEEGAEGSVRGEPPPQPGKGGIGEGEERPRRSPREQRVSVARDSSKETRGNKCTTNRWGGDRAGDAARRAAGGAAAAPEHFPRDSHPCHARPSPACLWDPPLAAAVWDTCPVRPHPCFGCTAWI